MKTWQFLLFILTALTLGCSRKELTEQFSNEPVAAKALAAAGNGALGDTNIKYFGRWDFSNTTQYVSNWGGAYVRVGFTGTTIKIKVGTATDYFAKIDNGPWVSYRNASGTINLTPTPLANGTHTITVAQGKDYNYVFNFRGFVLDAGATTSAPSTAADIIEYIGDSITAGFVAGTNGQANVSAYGWVCSEALSTEHTQIAYPGICLASGFPDEGMDTRYFKRQDPAFPSSPAWDFTRYTPRLIVINLGTNDNNQRVPDSTFLSRYITFLTNIRAKFPAAEIFVMRTFLGVKAGPTVSAVNARNAAGDTKVHYINTNGWLTSADYSDGLHPSVSGHIKAANLLQPILEPYIKGTPPPTQPQVIANGTYKIVNRYSGQVLDAKNQGVTDGTSIQQWTYGGTTNQRWTVTHLGNGQYSIVGVQSGKLLEVAGQSTSVGAKLQLWTSSGTDNQKWTIEPVSGGYYTVTGVQSNKVMELAGLTNTTGAAIQIWDNIGAANQQWAFQTP